MTTPQQEMLFKAIEQGNVTKVGELFAQTVLDPNFIINGTTPVHLAAQIGNAAILRVLLEHGANRNIYNAYGIDAVDATTEYIQDQHLEPIQYGPVFELLLGETAPTTTTFYAAVAASC